MIDQGGHYIIHIGYIDTNISFLLWKVIHHDHMLSLLQSLYRWDSSSNGDYQE